jgi:hypothetical protein
VDCGDQPVYQELLAVTGRTTALRSSCDQDLAAEPGKGSLRDSVGNALDLTAFVHDGRGNDGTQSTIYGINNPRMHVCGVNLAMKGVHRSQNDLFCAG